MAFIGTRAVRKRAKGDAEMQLKGKMITHTKFGSGVVVGVESGIVTVAFAEGEKKFLFPGAFSHFLTFEDTESQTYVDQLLNRINREKESLRQKEHKARDRLKQLRRLRISPNSQAAFGFAENTREAVFSAWMVSTGRYKGGYSKGQPRVPTRLKPNSACLLAERPEGKPERERKIIGAFMVRDDFDGALCEEGKIQSHEKYRIELQAREALPFWNYFPYVNQPPKWGGTEMRYFSNRIMQRILYDIQDVVADPERKETAKEFYRYFCSVNRLPDLKSEPAGDAQAAENRESQVRLAERP